MSTRRKQANSNDVAARAGVSRTTVSYVLSGRSGHSISQETRDRVLQAAQDLHYRSNRLANGVLRGKSEIIGVIVPGMDNVFVGQIIQGIQDCCSAKGYQVLLAKNLPDPQEQGKQVHLMLEHRVEGIMFVTGEKSVLGVPDWITDIHNAGVTSVVIDDRSFSDSVQCVVTDDIYGGQAATEHLIKLGHTRIGHVAGGQTASTARDRRFGYERALAHAKLPVREDYVVGFSYMSPDTGEHVARLMQSPEPPTALFVASDHMVPRVLDALGALGLEVPGNVALVGYGDVELAPCLQLTTVRQDYFQMGFAAANRMFQILQNTDHSTDLITVPTQLVIRGSCGTPVTTWPRYIRNIDAGR